MIIAQQPAQSLAALHGPLEADICIARKQQDVALTLVIALSMIMFDVFAQRPPQGRQRILQRASMTFAGDEHGFRSGNEFFSVGAQRSDQLRNSSI